MFIELTIKELKELLSTPSDTLKVVGADKCLLCYVEKVQETIMDWTEEAKQFWATDPEYLAWKKRDRERVDWELKTYGHSSFEFSPWDNRYHMQDFPNPELEKGTYVAYFTTKPLEKQWGDDWDDAPYEHNAGIPYDDITYGKDENGKSFIESREDFVIYKVYFTPKHDYVRMPEDYGFGGNSPFCVDDINKGAVAWLFNGDCGIQGGTTLPEFLKIIEEGF